MIGCAERDELAEREPTALDSLREEQGQPEFDPRHPVRHVLEGRALALGQLPRRVEAVRGVVGGVGLEGPVPEPGPDRALGQEVAGRRTASVLRALEARPVEIVGREEEVLGTGLAVDAEAAGLSLVDRARTRRVRDVDDQDRDVQQLRQRDRALDRLAFRESRVGDRVIARGGRARLEEPGREPGDHVVVLGVDHGEGAEAPRRGQDVQELLVPEAQAVVRHVDLERGDALGDQPGQLLVERVLRRVGQDQVERVVDHRLLAGPAVVVLHHRRELHPAMLGREGHDRRGAAEGGRHGARVEVVGAHDARRRDLLEMAVAVDSAGQDVEAGGVDLTAAGRERLAERRDPRAVDPDVARRGGRRGDDGAVPDDQLMHGRAARHPAARISPTPWRRSVAQSSAPTHVTAPRVATGSAASNSGISRRRSVTRLD